MTLAPGAKFCPGCGGKQDAAPPPQPVPTQGGPTRTHMAATASGKRVAIETPARSLITCTGDAFNFMVTDNHTKTIQKQDLYDVYSMPGGNIAFRSVHSGGFLSADNSSAMLCQRSAAFDHKGKQVVPMEAAFKVQQMGSGKFALYSLTRRMYLCSSSVQTRDGRIEVRTAAAAPQPSQNTLFTVHRMGVPPPPPRGPYHVYTPPGGHAGQRKYLAYTGAVQCPTCKTALGVQPNTTFCQCGNCKTNLNARYAQPVKLNNGYTYDYDNYDSSDWEDNETKKHKKHKKQKKHKKEEKENNGLLIGACVVVGGVLIADAMPAEAWEGIGQGVVASGEFIGEGAMAGGELVGEGAVLAGEGVVAGAGFVADGASGLWESGIGDAMADGGEFVVDNAVEAGGFVADGAATAGGAIADGAGAVWDSGVLQDAGGAMADGAGAVGGAVADGAGAVWDSGVMQSVGGVAMDGAGGVAEGAVAGAEFAGEAGGAIAGFAGDAGGAIAGVAGDAGGAIAGVAGDAGGAIAGVAGDAGGAIAGVAGDAGGAIAGVAGDAGGAIAGVAGDAGGAIADVAGDAGGAVCDCCGSIGDICGDCFGSIGDICGGLGDCLGGLGDCLGGICDILG